MLDNPSLTTRYWPGPNPLRISIDRHDIFPDTLKIKNGESDTLIYETGDLKKILRDLYQRNIQALIVEGGKQLLQSFLEEGFWDKIRVETSPIRLKKGITAPQLSEVKVTDEIEIDGNHIQILRPLSFEY